MTRPCDLNATEARKLIGNKQLSPVELTKSCLEQVEKLNPSINAVVAIDNNDVLIQAKKAEEDVMSGTELGLLHGLPVGIKDLNIVRNLRSTSGSKIYEDRIPESDDTIVEDIRNEGAIIFCKTNTPESALEETQRIKFMVLLLIHLILLKLQQDPLVEVQLLWQQI